MTDLSHEGDQIPDLSYQLFDDGWTLPPFHDLPSALAQAELEGDWFGRNVEKVLQAGEKVLLPHVRRVRVVAGHSLDLGLFEFEAIADTQVTPSDFPHLPMGQARVDASGRIVYDQAFDGKPALGTIRKHGASTSGVNVDEMVLARGGDPDSRIQKPEKTGWLFGALPSTFSKRK